MRISKIEIKNYRSLEEIAIYPNKITALVGRNNSGKSNILRALELFFENSIRLVDTECYHHHQTGQEIQLTLTFEDLNAWETSQLGPWMLNQRLIVKRTITCNESDSSHEILTFAITEVPEPEWLQVDNINGENITKWW